MSIEHAQGRYVVRAVTRAAGILELLRSSDGGATLQQIASRSGLAKASALRMIRSLQDSGLVERVVDSDRYRLGVRTLALGQAYLEQVDFRSEAIPVLERLRQMFGETVHLGVLDDDLRVVYLDKLETTHPVGIMMSRVGRTAPSFCTGLGKALLAFRPGDPVAELEQRDALRAYTPNTIHRPEALRAELNRIRKLGFSLDLEEHEPGVRCVASPIRGPRQVIAAFSIAGPAHRLPERRLRGELATAALAAAEEISYRLGAIPAEAAR